MLLSIISLIVSIISLILVIINIIRYYLLDKEYCEFVISDKKMISGMPDINILSKNNPTLLFVDLFLLKSNIFNLSITEINKTVIKIKINSNIVNYDIIFKHNENQIINISGLINKEENIIFLYEDNKKNKFKQILKMSPLGKDDNNKIILWNASLSSRKWLFIDSFKNKYFN